MNEVNREKIIVFSNIIYVTKKVTKHDSACLEQEIQS
jgi:hypothetical protein